MVKNAVQRNKKFIFSLVILSRSDEVGVVMIMEWVEQLLLQWLLPALLLLLSATLFLASFGISLGVRRLYVRVLLRIFQVVQTNYLLANKNIL